MHRPGPTIHDPTGRIHLANRTSMARFTPPLAATRSASPPTSVPAIEIIEIPEFYFLDRDNNASPSRPAGAIDYSTPGLSGFDVEAIRRDFRRCIRE